MRRKKENGTAGDEKLKYSVIIPPELDSKMERVCEARKWNRSLLLREILEKYLDRYLSESLGQILPDDELVVSLNTETKMLLETAAHNSNLTPAAVVQLLITRNLSTFVEESRSCHQHIAALLQQPAGEASPKSPPRAAGRKKK